MVSGNSTGLRFNNDAVTNQVLGNYIGTNAAGTGKIANGEGFSIDGDNTAVGNGTAAGRNVISGNNSTGIGIGSNASGTSVAGNFIGVDATGVAALGNGGTGINVSATGNTIGGTTTGARNVISNNGATGPGSGVALFNGSNTVQGNYIGVDATGTVAMGNNGDGVRVQSAGNTIGGTAAGAGNVISANTATGGFQAQGINLTSAPSTNNIIQGNFIGTDVTGTIDLGNSHRGIMLNSAGSNNQIGGTAAGAGNLISGNTWEAIGISFSHNNTIQGNKIGTDAVGTSSPWQPVGNRPFISE